MESTQSPKHFLKNHPIHSMLTQTTTERPQLVEVRRGFYSFSPILPIHSTNHFLNPNITL